MPGGLLVRNDSSEQGFFYRIYHRDPHNLYTWSSYISTPKESEHLNPKHICLICFEHVLKESKHSINSIQQQSPCCLIPCKKCIFRFHLLNVKSQKITSPFATSKSSARKRPWMKTRFTKSEWGKAMSTDFLWHILAYFCLFFLKGAAFIFSFPYIFSLFFFVGNSFFPSTTVTTIFHVAGDRLVSDSTGPFISDLVDDSLRTGRCRSQVGPKDPDWWMTRYTTLKNSADFFFAGISICISGE